MPLSFPTNDARTAHWWARTHRAAGVGRGYHHSYNIHNRARVWASARCCTGDNRRSIRWRCPASGPRSAFRRRDNAASRNRWTCAGSTGCCASPTSGPGWDGGAPWRKGERARDPGLHRYVKLARCVLRASTSLLRHGYVITGPPRSAAGRTGTLAVMRNRIHSNAPDPHLRPSESATLSSPVAAESRRCW